MENYILTEVSEELRNSYLTYALSVITDRALPSAYDGFKPVQRRILWDMLDLGNTHNKKHLKCAKPVGDTMAKWHPHGDSSIYEALVNLSQDWNMRYPLIDFSGNNGNRDGDGAAAYRYTESRLAKTAEYTMEGLKKNAVDFISNFDESLEEPEYLVGTFPHLLCNGALGIAVGYACSWLPHNLNGVADAVIAYLNNINVKDNELVDALQGPDFPTGGVIVNKNDLYDAYAKGKGKVIVRGEYHIEEGKKVNTIVFDSIPYRVSKVKILMELDEAIEQGKIHHVTDFRDETQRKNIRFIIEAEKTANIETVLKEIFAYTSLQTSHSFNQVAIVGKTPQLLSLKETIHHYVIHQENCLERIYNFDIDKLNKRNHILEGLLIALTDIDNIIETIKKSESPVKAKEALMLNWGLSEAQAQAILDMKLSRLTKVDKVKVETELRENKEKIAELKHKLEHLDDSLIEILQGMKKTFGDARRTTLTELDYSKPDKEKENIIAEDVVVILNKDGYIKRVPKNSYKVQKRNGKGTKINESPVMFTITTNTLDSLLVFTDKGNMYKLGVNTIAAGTSASKGQNINELVALDNEKVLSLVSYNNDSAFDSILFVTKEGRVKKTAFSEYAETKRSSGLIAIKLGDTDSLIAAMPIKAGNILIATKTGYCVLLNSEDVKIQGRATKGVKGIALKEGDYVISASPIAANDTHVVIVTEDGSGKKTDLNKLSLNSLGNRGIKIIAKDKVLVSILSINENDDILVFGETNVIVVNAKDIPEQDRTAQGVALIKNNKIKFITKY